MMVEKCLLVLNVNFVTFQIDLFIIENILDVLEMHYLKAST